MDGQTDRKVSRPLIDNNTIDQPIIAATNVASSVGMGCATQTNTYQCKPDRERNIHANAGNLMFHQLNESDGS